MTTKAMRQHLPLCRLFLIGLFALTLISSSAHAKKRYSSRKRKSAQQEVVELKKLNKKPEKLTTKNPISATPERQKVISTTLKTVLWEINGRRQIKASLASLVTDIVYGELQNAPGREIISHSVLMQTLDIEAEKQALDCTDTSCLAEISAALDAPRVITGSLDKIGKSYYFVLNEIDTENLKTMARVQGRFPFNEDQLFAGVIKLTHELIRDSRHEYRQQKSGSTKHSFSNSGIRFESSPRDVNIYYQGKNLGKTPLQVDNLPSGELIFELALDKGDPVPVSIRNSNSGAVKVLSLLNTNGDQDNSIIAEYEETKSSYDFWKNTGFALGTCCILIGTPLTGLLIYSGNPELYNASLNTEPSVVLTILGGFGCLFSGCLSFIPFGAGGLIAINTPDRPVIPPNKHKVVIEYPNGKKSIEEIEAFHKPLNQQKY